MSEDKVPFPAYNEAGIDASQGVFGDSNEDDVVIEPHPVADYFSRTDAAKILNGSNVIGLYDTSLEDYCKAIKDLDHFLRTGEYVIDDGM